jgi:tetratricopeptide (TPR) repeat protein
LLALAIVLGSVTPALGAERPETSELLSTDSPVSGSLPIGVETYALSPVIDLQDVSTKLESFEKILPHTRASRDYILIELSRLYWIRGELGESSERQQNYEKGRHYADLLHQEYPRRVEGHYWLALNLGGLAEVGGAKRGLRLVPAIAAELKAAQALDETYDQAGPHRALGRLYFMAPPWPLSVGDLNESLPQLRDAVRIAPQNSTNHLYLAETLLQLGQTRQGYRELERVLRSTHHAMWLQGLEEDRQQALRLMKEYRGGESQIRLPRERVRPG